MGLIETLVIGGYLYTTGVFLWLQDKYQKISNNHLRHVEDALNETRERVGLPPVKVMDSKPGE